MAFFGCKKILSTLHALESYIALYSIHLDTGHFLPLYFAKHLSTSCNFSKVKSEFSNVLKVCLVFDRAISKHEFDQKHSVGAPAVCSGLSSCCIWYLAAAERNALQLRAPSVSAASLLTHSDLVYSQRRSAAVMRILVV